LGGVQKATNLKSTGNRTRENAGKPHKNGGALMHPICNGTTRSASRTKRESKIEGRGSMETGRGEVRAEAFGIFQRRGNKRITSLEL